jgi:hypothetical protein
MTVIDCAGDGRSRGRAHGDAARLLVREAIARWEEATLSGQSQGADILEYARTFLASTGLIHAIEVTAPDLVEEMHGIAEAAGLPKELVAAYNLMDEQWWYDLGRQQVEPGCSLVALHDNGSTVLAQNMDLPSFMDGSQIVLRLSPPDGPCMLLLSSAGLIGLTGVNSAGVAICVNTLLMLRSNPDGLPVAAVVRHALAQKSATDARAVLESVAHASGQHYAVADRSGVFSFECSAGGCAPSSDPEATCLTHTNHPLASTDFDDSSRELLESRGRVAESRRRLAHLDDWLASGRTTSEVIALLDNPDAPICVRPSSDWQGQTFSSVMFRLGDEVEAWFRLDKAGDAPWQRISLEPGAEEQSLPYPHVDANLTPPVLS